MAFHVRNQKADRLVRELQDVTGESLTTAVTRALEERLGREREAVRFRNSDPLSVVQESWERLAGVEVRDTRSADEILGYGGDGLPH